jgi:hypothetical protein
MISQWYEHHHAGGFEHVQDLHLSIQLSICERELPYHTLTGISTRCGVKRRGKVRGQMVSHRLLVHLAEEKENTVVDDMRVVDCYSEDRDETQGTENPLRFHPDTTLITRARNRMIPATTAQAIVSCGLQSFSE